MHRPCIALFVAVSACLSVTSVSRADDPAASTQASPDPAPAAATNRLSRETSPYLLLHAHNPVDWYPWGPEAFEKARRENKPIFLSIGYSSCFWCHVMERESFSDEEIAKYMNEHFVNIKVDREERPDVDDIYMLALQVYQQAAGSAAGGGWPLSMFLTPDGKPIAGGTYFPPRPDRGMPGFLSVGEAIHNAWTTNQEQIAHAADVMAGEVRRASVPGVQLTVVPLDRSLIKSVVAATTEQFDPEYGGLDFDARRPESPKFPVPTRIALLQSQLGKVGDDAAIVSMLDSTLDHMLRGGIRDHLGGGFHRYSTDREWLVPHFEKMLYDNAQLAEVYCAAYERTGRPEYRDVAEETFAFVLRDLTGPDGGFYSALDAETDGVEGQHYVWTKDEVIRLLGEDDAELFASVYGLDEPEHFEHGYVLHLPRSPADAAAAHKIAEEELRERLSGMREKLLTARQQRPELLVDDKVLTSWNGLMIRALAQGGKTLHRPALIAAAERAARLILTELRDDEGRLLRTRRQEVSKLNAYLDDYAFFVDGLLALHRVTGQEEWLQAAQQLTDDQMDLFWDPQGKGFYFTSNHHEELLARTKNAYDSVLPSGNSVSVRNLVRLAHLSGDPKYREKAREALTAFASPLQNHPGSLTYMAIALEDYLAQAGESDSKPANGTDAEVADSAGSPESTTVEAAKFPVESADQPLVLAARTDPRQADAVVSAKAYLSVDKLPPGGRAEVAVVLSIKEGWHINANPARPEGQIATEMQLKSAQRTTLSRVAYPRGHDFRMAAINEPLSVYEGDIVLKGVLEAPRSAAGQGEELQLSVRYQACDDRRCLRPTDAVLTFKVPVAANPADVKAINRPLFATGRNP
ncbi:MAG: thioredoxin domain-containing protein [Planctomycetaceae bacterium]|nr:thioredoxin domain-containing protein [Planctomycetaceae bacterium]